MTPVYYALILLAAAAFALSMWRTPVRINLMAAGLLCLTLTFLVGIPIDPPDPPDPPDGEGLTADTWADVQRVHDTVAQDGDTIRVKAGTHPATVPTTITKYVRVIADGAVTITNQVPATEDWLRITPSPAGSTWIEGFTVDGNAHSGNSGLNATVQIYAGEGGAGQPVVITRNRFLRVTGNTIYAATIGGVIADNTFEGIVGGGNCFNNASALRHKPQWDMGSWTRPATLGNADAAGTGHLYFEGNTLKNALEGVDVDDNGRTVVRFNELTNSSLTTHGDTSFPGGRYFEAYMNRWIRDVTPVPECPQGLWVNWNGVATWRAGTGLLIGNEIPDISDAAWGDKSEVVLRVDGLRRSSGGPYACWKKGWPFPAQTGWGYREGSTQAGDTGHYYDPARIIIAANTGAGNYLTPVVADYGGTECGADAHSAVDYVKRDREFTNAVAGARASRPATAPNGSAYWSTDQGGDWNTTNAALEDGCLDARVGDAWRDCAYVPARYPHAIRQPGRRR